MTQCQYRDDCEKDARYQITNRESSNLDKKVCSEHKDTIMIHETSAYSDDNPKAEPL